QKAASSLTLQQCHITNPELSGGKMPDAGRNMTWDLRAPAPTPSHLRATVAIKGSFRGAEF
ncbi:TPA: hypothetical protein ACG7O9_005221, partial [Escherichia coli]